MSIDTIRVVLRPDGAFASVEDLKTNFAEMLMQFLEEYPKNTRAKGFDPGSPAARAVVGGVRQGFLGVLEYLDSITDQLEQEGSTNAENGKGGN